MILAQKKKEKPLAKRIERYGSLPQPTKAKPSLAALE